MVFVLNDKLSLINTYLFQFDVIHKSLDQFTGKYNMLKHGLPPILLIFTIIQIAFGGITETKGSAFVFSYFLSIISGLPLARETDKKRLSNCPNFQNQSSLFVSVSIRIERKFKHKNWSIDVCHKRNKRAVARIIGGKEARQGKVFTPLCWGSLVFLATSS